MSVLGDVVNAALQLEATTVDLRVPILASASVADALPPARRDAVRSLGEVAVKGRRHPMLVYAAAGLDEDMNPGAELRHQ
jgi:class 3 adenylate cyclase